MNLETAEKLANNFIREIADFCVKIRIVGSIRRRKPEVKDVDLVLIVEDWFGFIIKLQQISEKFLIDGTEQKRVIYNSQQFDLYLASQETYETLILIRTGSGDHNIYLSKLALSKGMRLTHKGLTKDNKIVASTEKEIFAALDLPYIEPQDRG